MLQGEHSAILLTFIKLPFVIMIFVLSIFEWRFYTGFTVISCSDNSGSEYQENKTSHSAKTDEKLGVFCVRNFSKTICSITL